MNFKKNNANIILQQLCYSSLEKPSTSRVCLETIVKKGAIGTSPRSVVSSLKAKEADSSSEWMPPPWNSLSSCVIVWWYLYWQMSQNGILRWFGFRLNRMFGLNSKVLEVKPPQTSMPCIYPQLKLIACREMSADMTCLKTYQNMPIALTAFR